MFLGISFQPCHTLMSTMLQCGHTEWLHRLHLQHRQDDLILKLLSIEIKHLQIHKDVSLPFWLNYCILQGLLSFTKLAHAYIQLKPHYLHNKCLVHCLISQHTKYPTNDTCVMAWYLTWSMCVTILASYKYESLSQHNPLRSSQKTRPGLSSQH